MREEGRAVTAFSTIFADARGHAARHGADKSFIDYFVGDDTKNFATGFNIGWGRRRLAESQVA